MVTLEQISTLLEPIKNSVEAMKIDLHAIRVHVDSINERLYKMEGRQITTDNKLDNVIRTMEQITAQHEARRKATLLLS